MVFCTLFDSHYLDKGIVLYQSLERCTDDFLLYIFCFDQRTYDILNDLNYVNVILIRHDQFETQQLLKIKEGRSKAEYCWTCTPIVIEYVLSNYAVDSCTYIDSDLFFFSDPKVLFREIDAIEADVTIVEHRFKNSIYGRRLEKRNGKYCVEFNYFRQTEQAYKVLRHWKEQCLEWCYDIPEEDRMGDQKYLNTWPRDYLGVHVLEHLGGGVAPWNLEQYSLIDMKSHEIRMSTKDHHQFSLIFYHFQNIRFINNRYVNIKSQTRNRRLKYSIYIPYLSKLMDIREMLKKEYGLSYEEKGIVRSSNKILGILQKCLAAYKIRYWSDIINVKKLEQYNTEVK